jgi:hypothetical protein
MSKVSDPTLHNVQEGRCQQTANPLYPRPRFINTLHLVLDKRMRDEEPT